MTEAQAEYNQALEIDPLSPFTNTMAGWAYVLSRQPEEAIARGKPALEIEPMYFLAHLLIGEAYQQKSNNRAAILHLQKGVKGSGEHPLALAWLAIGYGRSGKADLAQKTLIKLMKLSGRQFVPPYFMALIYATLGEKRAAFDWLERAKCLRFVSRLFESGILSGQPPVRAPFYRLTAAGWSGVVKLIKLVQHLHPVQLKYFMTA